MWRREPNTTSYQWTGEDTAMAEAHADYVGELQAQLSFAPASKLATAAKERLWRDTPVSIRQHYMRLTEKGA